MFEILPNNRICDRMLSTCKNCLVSYFSKNNEGKHAISAAVKAVYFYLRCYVVFMKSKIVRDKLSLFQNVNSVTYLSISCPLSFVTGTDLKVI